MSSFKASQLHKVKIERILRPVSFLFILLGVLVACSSAGKSPDDSTDKTAPTTPANFSFVVGDAKVTLNWAANTEKDLKGYNLYWSTTIDDLSNTVLVDKSFASKIITGLSNGTPYYFALDAEDASGNKSAKTQIVLAQPEVADTTAPTIVSRRPTANATNVEVRTPVTILFSEAMKLSTLTNESVKLSDSSATNISTTLSLSEDGRILTVTPTEKLIAPNTFAVTLTNAVTDVAGNALANESWSFEVPQWLNFDSTPVQQGGVYSIALDSSGKPFLASIYDGTLYVKYWNGSAWEQLGTGLNIGTGKDAREPFLVVDNSDTPIVAWLEAVNSSPMSTYVKRWNGSAWIQYGIGGPLNDVSTKPYLAVDSSGTLFVAYLRLNDGIPNIYIHYWNESSWGTLPTIPAKYGDGSLSLSLAIDSLGNPIVAWGGDAYPAFYEKDIYIKRWNGSVWVDYGTGTALDVNLSATARYPAISLDGSDYPTVAWKEENGGNHNIYIKKWNGSSWVQLSGSLNVVDGQYIDTPSLSLDTLDNPVITWEEFDGNSRKIYVKYRNNNSWSNYGIGGALNVNLAWNAYKPSIILDNENKPVVAWYESDSSTFYGADGTTYSVHVKRLNQ
jgi:Bacterial Ig-like domain